MIKNLDTYFISLACLLRISEQCFFNQDGNFVDSISDENSSPIPFKTVENVESNIRCALICKTTNGKCKSIKLDSQKMKCFLFQETIKGTDSQ